MVNFNYTDPEYLQGVIESLQLKVAALEIKVAAPSASPNTGMDAIPLWAVRTWLRRNVDSNLAIVETKIVEMVGIAEQHHT